MAIWLRYPRAAGDAPRGDLAGLCVGAASEIVRAEEFAALVSIDRAFQELAEQRQTLLDEASAQAARIIAEGEREALRKIDEARTRYDDAAEQGYRDGSERVLVECIDQVVDAQRAQARMRERLAGVVVVAVERIVKIEQRDRLFERALSEVDKIADGAAYLRVAVHPDDLEHARAAFAGLGARWRELGQSFPLYVSADAQLALGSCVCESDFGTIDASLETQLRAMGNAISRALKRAAAAPEFAYADDQNVATCKSASSSLNG